MRNVPILVMLLMIAAPLSGANAQRSLTLNESFDLALRNNYELKNSELEHKAAQQTRCAALTHYFPTISAGGLKLESSEPMMQMSLFGNSLGLLEKGTIGYVSAVQPVFAGGKIINKNRLAGVEENATLIKARIAKDEVFLKTEEQYWQIIALQEKAKTIDAYEEMLDTLLKQVEDAYGSGLVMRNDVLKVRLRRSEVLLSKSKLHNGIELSTMAFCQYIGLPLDTDLILDDSLVVGEPPQAMRVDHLRALRVRNEYRLLELSAKAERLQTNITLGGYLPQAAIGVAYQRMKLDEADGRSFGVVYGTVSLPISDWWGGVHELKRRKQEEKISENDLKNNSELLLLQMEKRWQDMTDAYTQYMLSRESRDQATENMKVNEDSYDNGLTAVSDLLEARALLQQTEDQLSDAEANYLIQKRRYLQATGR